MLLEFLIALGILPGCVWSVPTAGVTGAGAGDGEAVQPEKCSGVENFLKTAQNPQRQVHALLARFGF